MSLLIAFGPIYYNNRKQSKTIDDMNYLFFHSSLIFKNRFTCFILDAMGCYIFKFIDVLLSWVLSYWGRVLKYINLCGIFWTTHNMTLGFLGNFYWIFHECCILFPLNVYHVNHNYFIVPVFYWVSTSKSSFKIILLGILWLPLIIIFKTLCVE